MVTFNNIEAYSIETARSYNTEIKMDRNHCWYSKAESQTCSKLDKNATKPIKESHTSDSQKKHAKDAQNNQVRKKPSVNAKTSASAGRCQGKPSPTGNMDAAESQTEMRLAVVEEQLRALQESYRRKQWRHFRYLLPGAAAAEGLSPEVDLAAAAIISLRDQVDILQRELQNSLQRTDDIEVTTLKAEMHRLREEKNRQSDRAQKAMEMVSTFRQQLEEADSQLDSAAKRQAELERDYTLAHKALESVICDASDQEYAVNAADTGRRSADIILQLQLRLAELEKELQAERRPARSQTEDDAAQILQPRPLASTPSSQPAKRNPKKAGSKKAKEEPTAEEMAERLQVAMAELKEARALLNDADSNRKKQTADFAMLREDVRDLHNRVAAVTQLSKRERAFSDALKEALEDMELQWRRQFEQDEQQLQQAEHRQKEADQRLAVAEDAVGHCRLEADRLTITLQACRDREMTLRDQLLAAQPQVPSKMIVFLGIKLDEAERELVEVQTRLREEQQVSATLEAELCDYDDYFIDGTMKSYRMALTVAEPSNEYHEPIFKRFIDLENEIQQLKKQVEQLRVEKLCILQQCAEELSTSRYIFEEAFNQLIPKAYHSEYKKPVKLTVGSQDCELPCLHLTNRL